MLIGYPGLVRVEEHVVRLRGDLGQPERGPGRAGLAGADVLPRRQGTGERGQLARVGVEPAVRPGERRKPGLGRGQPDGQAAPPGRHQREPGRQCLAGGRIHERRQRRRHHLVRVGVSRDRPADGGHRGYQGVHGRDVRAPDDRAPPGHRACAVMVQGGQHPATGHEFACERGQPGQVVHGGAVPDTGCPLGDGGQRRRCVKHDNRDGPGQQRRLRARSRAGRGPDQFRGVQRGAAHRGQQQVRLARLAGVQRHENAGRRGERVQPGRPERVAGAGDRKFAVLGPQAQPVTGGPEPVQHQHAESLQRPGYVAAA